MATKKKMLEAAAGNAGGAGGLNVEDVFSTFLYTGTGSAQTITNGIDLAGEGGLVWIKSRTETTSNMLSDSERALTTRFLRTDLTNGEANNSASVTSHNSDGFTLGGAIGWNTSGANYASWTFRKAPKFFDVVTYTGNGVAGRTVSHDLGADVGFMAIKQTSASGENWICYHRSLGASSPIYLNLTSAASASTSLPFNSTAPTSTEFTLGNWAAVNGNGASYVAYLFAHNDGDGEFGPNGDADIIKCGSFTTNASGEATVTLGFEPQWVLIKRTDGVQDWRLFDSMRGMTYGRGSLNIDNRLLRPNLANAEQGGGSYVDPEPDGFWAENLNTNTPYIYIAIRRGPMAIPESATDVFAASFRVNSAQIEFESGFPVDMYIRRSQRNTAVNTEIFSRHQDTRALYTNTTDVEVNRGSDIKFDRMDGVNIGQSSADTNRIAWMWQRSPAFFDMVAYRGTGSTTQTKNHNLGVVPEMIWAKRRDVGAQQWGVYHKDIGYSNTLVLNDNSAVQAASAYWKATPTETEFYVGTGLGTSGSYYMAYLFASLDGVSKVGSVDITSTADFNVDCGFSSGARFVLVKAVNQASFWFVVDTERGIVSSAGDPTVYLNVTNVESSAVNWIEPYSSGFTIKGSFWNGYNLIYYAIA